MPSGNSNPLNLATVEPAIKQGVIAYNPTTKGGVPVTAANIDRVRLWVENGQVSCHTSHFSDCPARKRFRRGS
jgi:hypothetical protein